MAINVSSSVDRQFPCTAQGIEAIAPSATSVPSFRYLRDPVCIASMLIYALNRWVLKPNEVGRWLVHDHLNALLCLPLFLPIILWLQALLGIRRHDRPPTFLEVLHNWAVFSVVFEIVIPRLTMFNSIADSWDSVAYLVGGMVAYLIWNRVRVRGIPRRSGRTGESLI